MALRATPTIAICLTAGIAAGVALSRPADTPAPAATAATAAAPDDTSPTPTPTDPAGRPDSPYLADDDGTVPSLDTGRAPAADEAPPTAITIEDFQFAGAQQVAAGAAISVTNLDGAPHTLTARDGQFDTGTLQQNDQFVVSAPAASGIYEFFCAIHPSMVGELIVG